MWIRNQDRTALLDCDNFEIESYSETHEVVTLNNRTNITVDLGIYSSKEKAMKVLNDIESHLESHSDCVFYMEDNDEVGEDYTIEERIDGLIRAYQRNIDDNCKYIENTGNNVIDLRNENSYFEQFIESLKYAKTGEIDE